MVPAVAEAAEGSQTWLGNSADSPGTVRHWPSCKEWCCPAAAAEESTLAGVVLTAVPSVELAVDIGIGTVAAAAAVVLTLGSGVRIDTCIAVRKVQLLLLRAEVVVVLLQMKMRMRKLRLLGVACTGTGGLEAGRQSKGRCTLRLYPLRRHCQHSRLDMVRVSLSFS